MRWFPRTARHRVRYLAFASRIVRPRIVLATAAGPAHEGRQRGEMRLRRPPVRVLPLVQIRAAQGKTAADAGRTRTGRGPHDGIKTNKERTRTGRGQYRSPPTGLVWHSERPPVCQRAHVTLEWTFASSSHSHLWDLAAAAQRPKRVIHQERGSAGAGRSLLAVHSASWNYRMQALGGTVARAWRGHGAGVARAVGHCLACVARAWRGHGAGVACDPRGNVAQEPCGAGAMWRRSHVAQEPYGAGAMWRRSHVAPEPCGAGAMWRRSHMAPEPYGAGAMWCRSHGGQARSVRGCPLGLLLFGGRKREVNWDYYYFRSFQRHPQCPGTPNEHGSTVKKQPNSVTTGPGRCGVYILAVDTCRISFSLCNQPRECGTTLGAAPAGAGAAKCTAEEGDASGTRPFLQILSCGTRPGHVRDASAAVSPWLMPEPFLADSIAGLFGNPYRGAFRGLHKCKSWVMGWAGSTLTLRLREPDLGKVASVRTIPNRRNQQENTEHESPKSSTFSVLLTRPQENMFYLVPASGRAMSTPDAKRPRSDGALGKVHVPWGEDGAGNETHISLGEQEMPAPRPRHARATPAPPQAKKMPIARAMPAPRPHHCPVPPGIAISRNWHTLAVGFESEVSQRHAEESIPVQSSKGCSALGPVQARCIPPWQRRQASCKVLGEAETREHRAGQAKS
eukprot:gene7299-biopygen7535